MAKGARRGRSGARPKGDDAQKGGARGEAQKGGVQALVKDTPPTDAKDETRAKEAPSQGALDEAAPKGEDEGAKGEDEGAQSKSEDATGESNLEKEDAVPKATMGKECTGTGEPAPKAPPKEPTPNEPTPNEPTPQATPADPTPSHADRNVAALHDTIARLQSELDDTQRAIAESHSAFAEQLVAMHTQHAQELTEAAAKADTAPGEHADARDAADRFAQLEKEHASFTKAHDEHKSALDAAHEAQRVAEQRADDERARLERDLEAVRAERDAARADLASASASVTSLEAQLAERTASAQDVDALQQRIAVRLSAHAGPHYARAQARSSRAPCRDCTLAGLHCTRLCTWRY